MILNDRDKSKENKGRVNYRENWIYQDDQKRDDPSRITNPL